MVSLILRGSIFYFVFFLFCFFAAAAIAGGGRRGEEENMQMMLKRELNGKIAKNISRREREKFFTLYNRVRGLSIIYSIEFLVD